MPVVPLDRLIEFLAANLEERPELALLIYAPFGILRGKLTRGTGSADAVSPIDQAMLVLEEVTVEHYSNHIPTASYRQLSVNLNDVQGCAILE